MKRVAIEGVVDPVDVHTHKRLLDVIVAAGAPVLMACGGKGLCATCHVYVQAGAEQLSQRTPREQLALRMLSDRRPSSRLACQAKVLREGIKIALPKGQFIDGTTDLEALIGRRAEEQILHPITGLVLIAAGKIITRSRVRELSFVDVDVQEMRARSMTIERELGGQTMSQRCRVVHPRGMRPEAAALVGRDCDQDVAAVERYVDVHDTPRITVFLFQDSAQKRALMGAADVYIAKPWRREVYVQMAGFGGYPHPVLRHELAHVIAGQFARGPFKIAGDLGGVIPDPGLIEGIAEAASPDDDELTLEQHARVSGEIEGVPDPEPIFARYGLGDRARRADARAALPVPAAGHRADLHPHGGGDLRPRRAGALRGRGRRPCDRADPAGAPPPARGARRGGSQVDN